MNPGFEGFGFSRNFHQQLLHAKNQHPNPSASTSRRVKSAGIDRDSCVKTHDAFRAHWMMQMSSEPFTLHTSFQEESLTASAPLSSLKPITLQQLVVGKRHYGRVLHGRLCVKPFRMSAILSVLEDEAGNGARLTIYNATSTAASLQDIEARFPLGMRVIVKEPFFKICVDGKTALRVDNPADISVDKSWKKDISPRESCDDATLLAELEVIRSEGNKLFGAQNWIGAANKYSECIENGIRKMGTQNSRTRSDKFNRVVMLAYSNRAEARLRLGAYEDALSDADKALELDQKHVKTIVLKGKAAYGLGLFEKSCAIFKAAREQSSNEVSILDNLKASRIALEQSRTGEYELSDYFSRGCTGDVPACADFVGPVEIRRVRRGYGGRGLFATEKVEPGQLLLVSNPLVSRRRKSHLGRVDISFLYQRGSFNGSSSTGVESDVVVELADLVMKSKRKRAQLYCLSSYGKLEMEIPSMELFRPGSEWISPGSEKMEVDIALIREIAKLNAFGSTSVNLRKLIDRGAKGDAPFEDEWSGIWALPSFLNHSCAPNCEGAFVGDAMFIRAATLVAEGDELNVSYHGDLFESVETRQAFCKPWHFTCQCERCTLEETLKPQLAKISKAIPNLVKAAEAESRVEGQQKRNATNELAKVADKIESLIHSLGTQLGPRQQGWIRASFMAVYSAKFILATVNECDFQRITSLTVLLELMASVSVTDLLLQLAATLLGEVERRDFKRSQSYRLTRKRVLGIYRVAFGKQPNSVLHKLIRSRAKQSRVRQAAQQPPSQAHQIVLGAARS